MWWHQDRLVFKFAGIDSISAAEAFEDADVCIPREEREPLPDGEYYQSDLVGCTVVELRTGEPVGVVEDWQEYGGPALLQVKTAAGREVMIPFAKAICKEIDPAGKRIVVDLPEGLLDLDEGAPSV